MASPWSAGSRFRASLIWSSCSWRSTFWLAARSRFRLHSNQTQSVHRCDRRGPGESSQRAQLLCLSYVFGGSGFISQGSKCLRTFHIGVRPPSSEPESFREVRDSFIVLTFLQIRDASHEVALRVIRVESDGYPRVENGLLIGADFPVAVPQVVVD